MIRFDYKVGKKLFFTLTIVFLLMFTSFQFQDKASAQTIEQRTLVFEEGFEGSIANFWNENHGTTTLTKTMAHSGSYSLVVNGEAGGLVHNFPSTIYGGKWDFEEWFYDNMSSARTFIMALSDVDWAGTVTLTGSDYGFNSISGSMDDSMNKGNPLAPINIQRTLLI